MQIRAWLAILAMALQALWPLIAQARPVTLVPVCTVAGVTHYIELPDGKGPSDVHHKHCSFCVSGPGALPEQRRFSTDSQDVSYAQPTFARFVLEEALLSAAEARAPPVLPFAMTFNELRRTNEKAFAC